jgi:hypothetical protein
VHGAKALEGVVAGQAGLGAGELAREHAEAVAVIERDRGGHSVEVDQGGGLGGGRTGGEEEKK